MPRAIADPTAASRLEALARARFHDIEKLPAELDFIKNTATGEETIRGEKQDYPWISESDNADKRQDWLNSSRQVRAEIVRWICVTPEARELVHPAGIQLTGMRVVGHLNLRFVTLPFPVSFYRSRLETIDLTSATISLVGLVSCWCGSISATNSHFSGGLNWPFARIDGMVLLGGSDIGGFLSLSGTTINQGLYGNDIKVGGNVLMNSTSSASRPYPFRVNGDASLAGARIGGNLDLTGGQFLSPRGYALTLSRVVVVGDIIFGNKTEIGAEGKFLASGWIDLRGASVSAVIDNGTEWPNSLAMEGFSYSTLTVNNAAATADSGLKWLAHEQSGALQPYHQLAHVLDSIGDVRGAVAVREEMERRISLKSDLLPMRLFRRSIGYGYEPENALYGLAALTAIGWLLCWRARRMGLMVPTQKEAFDQFKSTGSPPPNYPRFAPLVYSLENTFPLVKLGQGDKWHPSPEGPPVPAQPTWKRLVHWLRCPYFTREFGWIQILIGWVLAGIFAAAIAGWIRHG